MRQKKAAVLGFASNDEGLPKVVRDYRARYRAISQVLDKNLEILDAVHQDLKKLSQGGRKGRKGDFTSENILRALVVQHVEGLPLREAVIRIGSDPCLQDFLRLRKKAVMDFTFLDKCFPAIRPETWKRVNELLGRHAIEQAVNPKVIRADTTLIESNIHYPTDCSLLWDTWRVASRLLERAREIAAESLPHRFHTRKIKGLYLYVTRYIVSKSASRQQAVKARFRTLSERVDWIVKSATDFCDWQGSSSNLELAGVALELKAFLPSMQTVVRSARRANVTGETVPDAGFQGQGAGALPGVSGGNRGHYFGLETRLSLVSLFLSRIQGICQDCRAGRVLPQPDRAGGTRVWLRAPQGANGVSTRCRR